MSVYLSKFITPSDNWIIRPSKQVVGGHVEVVGDFL
nr:MAG TPA: hypothetical protein [Caudoviricetes sp.]